MSTQSEIGPQTDQITKIWPIRRSEIKKLRDSHKFMRSFNSINWIKSNQSILKDTFVDIVRLPWIHSQITYGSLEYTKTYYRMRLDILLVVICVSHGTDH